MAGLRLPYGKNYVDLGIADLNLSGILKGKSFNSDKSEELIIKEGLQDLSSYVNASSKLLIIASDFTRKVGTEKILPLLVNRLEQLGIPTVQIKILFSTGLHRFQTEAEKKSLLGELYGKIEAVDHDCNGESVSFGRISFGTEVSLNPLVRWADLIILTGGINFHYFAGFTGGRKALFPGVAKKEAILQNHRLIFSKENKGFHPLVRPGRLQGNPVAEDLQEAAELVSRQKKLYLFNAVLNSEGRISKIFSGDYKTEFWSGCEFYRQHNSVQIIKKAELVIASAGGFPHDTNLIQSHKALYHAFEAVQENGVLFLLAECGDGLTGKGENTDRLFADYFKLSLEKMDELFRKQFNPNCNTAYSIAEKANKCRIILVSRLEPELVKKLGLYPAGDLEQGLKIASSYLGKKLPETYVIENSATLLPVAVENQRVT